MMKKLAILLIMVSGTVYAETGSSDRVMYEVLDRLEQLQREVQQLRGQVEEQIYTIEQLKKRQNTMYTDIDQRLMAFEGGDALGVEQSTTASETMSPDQVKDPSPQQKKTAVQPAKGDEKQIYQEAYDKLRNGHYSQAIVLFKQITVDYPEGEYADNAQYWLGETYKVNRDIDSARKAFEKVIYDYPNSPKVPDAMLKLGYLELEQNNLAQGRKYLTEVSLRYPGTPAANLAEERLKTLD